MDVLHSFLCIFFIQVDLKFVVSDSRNRTAVLTPRVQICACRDKSTCVVPEGAGNATFVVMSCNCNLGYTGQFCNEVVNFCNEGASIPCSTLVTCTNTPTQAECGPCPTGYSGNGVFCLGGKLAHTRVSFNHSIA